MRFLICFLFWAAVYTVSQADDWVRAGNEAYRSGDLAKAVEAFRTARHTDPKNYEVTWKLARSLSDQGVLMKRSPQQKERFLEALALAQEATRLNPKVSKAVVYVAISEGKVVLFDGGKQKVELGKDVKAQSEKAIELNRGAVAHHVELGLTYLEMKQWADGRDEFEKALHLPKQYPTDENYQQQAREGLKQAKRYL